MNPLPVRVFVLPSDADVFTLPKTAVDEGKYYEGEWLCSAVGPEYNGLTPFRCHPHGCGTVFDADGLVIYEGGIKHGVFSGCGAYSVGGETRYLGNFEAGQFDGVGHYMYACGARYNGDFVKGKRQGQGHYTYACGTTYFGSWRDDCRHGQGVQRSVQGTEYTGDWEDGKRHGHGFVVHKQSGVFYRGDYRHNKWHGHGEWHDPGGGTVLALTYTGAFVHGVRAGEGHLECSNGHTVQGQFSNNVPVHARVDFTDGSSYTGGLRDELFDGLGEYRSVNGVVYSGGWRHGRRHGEGRMDEGDSSWTGAWAADLPEGSVLLQIGNEFFTSTFARGVETRRVHLPAMAAPGDATAAEDNYSAPVGDAAAAGDAACDVDFDSYMAE